jgi:hypothetical protein
MTSFVADSLVVRTRDLLRVLQPLVAEQDATYYALGVEGVDDDPLLSGRQMLRERCASALTGLLWSAGSLTSFSVADEILCKCGIPHLLTSGAVPVYKNPDWSDEYFEREMWKRGVEGDPWDALDLVDKRKELVA